jgi:hypothetical protein
MAVADSNFSVVAWRPNTLDVFGIGLDNALWHTRWNGSAWEQDWDPLGGQFISNPVAVPSQERIDAFGVGPDKAIWHNYTDVSGWRKSWESLGGLFISKPAAVSWGPDRIDVFGIGLDNALWHNFWNGSSWQGGWNSLGGRFISNPAAVAWGPNRIDVFAVGTDLAIYHYAWDGSTWTPASGEDLGGGFDGDPAVVACGPGRLDVFGRGLNDAVWHRGWNGGWDQNWVQIGAAVGADPVAVSWGPDRIDLFLRSANLSLLHNSWNGSAWQQWDNLGGQSPSLPAAACCAVGRVDVFERGTDAGAWHDWWAGAWQNGWSPIGGGFHDNSMCPTMPAPDSGLGSNSNYILYDRCNALRNVSVEITITEDIVCQSSANGSLSPPGNVPTNGFGFQLNGYSAAAETCAWQQYVIALFGTKLIGAVDNWPVSGSNIINDFFVLVDLGEAKLPAGYRIEIRLGSDPNNGNVTQARYIVLDNQSRTVADTTVVLASISGVTTADLAPLTAFELNLVGPINAESCVLSSGAGTILYYSDSTLRATDIRPTCTESSYITAETANSHYGTLGGFGTSSKIQTFTVSTELAMIRKPGNARPRTLLSPQDLEKLLESAPRK